MYTQHLALDMRIVLAGVFLLSGLLKIIRGNPQDPIALLEAIGISPIRALRLAVHALPVAEIGLGVWLLTASNTVYALMTTAILLLGFSAVLLLAMRRGYEGSCSCFGDSASPGVASTTFNALLLGGALFAIDFEMSDIGPAQWAVDMSAGDGVAAAVMGSFVFAVRAMIREVESVKRLLNRENPQ